MINTVIKKVLFLTDILLALLLTNAEKLSAQNVGITADGSTPHTSAILDLKSADKGILIPRMTAAQRSAIINPAAGLLVFQTDGAPGFCYYNGNAWINLSRGQSINAEGFSSRYGFTTTYAGSVPGFANGTGSSAAFWGPAGLVADPLGNLYVADFENYRIRKISTGIVVTTLAGNGIESGIDGTGTAASFSSPIAITLDASGIFYVADYSSSSIRKIVPLPDGTGVVSTFAGGGAPGHADGSGISARFSKPSGLAADASGNVFVCDHLNNMIRKIVPLANGTGLVTTFAGSGAYGTLDGTGTAASFAGPLAIAADKAGNLYVTEAGNSIRKITPDGMVTTLAGSGLPGATDGIGTAASFNMPRGIAIDRAGNIYVADTGNNKVRKISQSADGTVLVSTLTGNGAMGNANGAPQVAAFSTPVGLATDRFGNLYVTDNASALIRKITVN